MDVRVKVTRTLAEHVAPGRRLATITAGGSPGSDRLRTTGGYTAGVLLWPATKATGVSDSPHDSHSEGVRA